MPVIRLLHEDLRPDEKVVLAADLSKKMSTCFKSFKDKLSINMAHYDIIDCTVSGKKVKLGSKTYDTRKSFAEQGIQAGNAIYFQKRGPGSPKREKKGFKFAPAAEPEQTASPAASDKAPTPAAAPPPAPPQAPKVPTPAPTPAPAPAPSEPKPPTPQQVKAPTPQPAKPPTPQSAKPPTPQQAKAPMPDPPKPPTPQPAAPAPESAPTPQPAKPPTPQPAKEPTPQAPKAPTPAAAPKAPTPQPQPPTPQEPKAPTPAAAAPQKPPTPVAKQPPPAPAAPAESAPPPPPPAAKVPVAQAAAPQPVQAAPAAPAPTPVAAQAAHHQATLAAADLSVNSVELVALREELGMLQTKRKDEGERWDRERQEREQSLREVEDRLQRMRTDELDLSKTAKDESLRREREARVELESEKKRFDAERERLEKELQRFKKDDEERRVDVEKNRRQIEIEKAEFRRRHLQSEIDKLETEASKISSQNASHGEVPGLSDASTHSAAAAAPATVHNTDGVYLPRSPDKGPRPGESEDDYRRRIQRIALQVLELEVQEEVLARDLQAAEQRRETLSRIQRTQAALPAEPWWHETRRRASPPRRGLKEDMWDQSPTPSTPGRARAAVDQRRREAAARRLRGYDRSPSPPHRTHEQDDTKQAVKQVLSLMQDHLQTERGTTVKAQERVSEALREMRSVKEELGKWRQCLASERTDLALPLMQQQVPPPQASPPAEAAAPQAEPQPQPVPVPDLASSVPSNLREYGVELMELMMEKAMHTRPQPPSPVRPRLVSEEAAPSSPFDVNDYRDRTRALQRIKDEELGSMRRSCVSPARGSVRIEDPGLQGHHQGHAHYMQGHGVAVAPSPPAERWAADTALPVGCQIVGDSQVVMPLEVAKALMSSQQLQHHPQLGSARQGVLASPSASPSPAHGLGDRRMHGSMRDSSAPVSPEPVPAQPWASRGPASPQPSQPVLGGFLTDAYSVSSPAGAPQHAHHPHHGYAMPGVGAARRHSPDMFSSHSLASPQASPRAASPYSAPSQPRPAHEAIRQAKEVIQSYQIEHAINAVRAPSNPNPYTAQQRQGYGY